MSRRSVLLGLGLVLLAAHLLPRCLIGDGVAEVPPSLHQKAVGTLADANHMLAPLERLVISRVRLVTLRVSDQGSSAHGGLRVLRPTIRRGQAES